MTALTVPRVMGTQYPGAGVSVIETGLFPRVTGQRGDKAESDQRYPCLVFDANLCDLGQVLPLLWALVPHWKTKVFGQMIPKAPALASKNLWVLELLVCQAGPGLPTAPSTFRGDSWDIRGSSARQSRESTLQV